SRLASLDYALKQLQEGPYGICEGCGKPINPARLEAVPEATLCVECKAINERQPEMGAKALPFSGDFRVT
ncbi:MAG: TraR/DksA family transcriptional regulator, partial [Anaerolineales bacterium]